MSRTAASLALACLLGLLVSARVAHPCTNILVAPGAGAASEALLAYAADSHTLYGALGHLPAADHPPGSQRVIIDWDSGNRLGTIPEVPHTYEVIGLMNEHLVAIGETTFGGREELQDPTGGVDYGSLMFLALQRARSARQAIEVMTGLVAEHGYASSGESFSVADPKEAWLLEMIGRGPGRKGAVWVARRVPPGHLTAHANQARIQSFPLRDPANCLYSPDVISLAREKGYFSGRDEEFRFADAYAPLTFEALRICEARVWSVFRRAAPSLNLQPEWAMGKPGGEPLPLWIRPDAKVGPAQVMALLRDHFEGSPMDLSQGLGAGPHALPYRWRPLTWEVDGQTYFNERAISTQQTGFSFVAQLRGALPPPVAGVLWFGVDDTYSTVYVPMYAGLRRVPPAFAEDTADFQRFSWDSAFWTFNAVANLVYGRYGDMIGDVQAAQAALEGSFFARQAEVEASAQELFRRSPGLARDYLDAYSAEASAQTLRRWQRLFEELMVRYLDGNRRDEHGQVQHPGYSPAWLRRVALDAGESLQVHPLPGEPAPLRRVEPAGYFHSRAELGPRAAALPPDLSFDAERLFLLPGSDRCSRPPQCCLRPEPSADGSRLLLPAAPAEDDPCGQRDQLVRLPRAEVRPLFAPGGSH